MSPGTDRPGPRRGSESRAGVGAGSTNETIVRRSRPRVVAVVRLGASDWSGHLDVDQLPRRNLSSAGGVRYLFDLSVTSIGGGVVGALLDAAGDLPVVLEAEDQTLLGELAIGVQVAEMTRWRP